MSKKGALLAFLALGMTPAFALPSSYLLFFEAQMVAGVETASKKIFFYSHDSMESMQKPSLGFDLVQRFSGETGDFAILAIQARLAFNMEDGQILEPQLYNAYLKLKTPAGGIWIGHNRPKFGLASSLDSHALLLQPLSMYGFGFDRDWGMGVEQDFAWGNAGLSATAGSGMALRLGDSYLLAARTSFGVLERDNLCFGFSAGYGRTWEVMGSHILSSEPARFALAGLDLTWLWNNWENRAEFIAGDRAGSSAAAFFWRLGLGLLEEGRLKLEAQPVIYKAGRETRAEFAVGITYRANADWTFRMMIQRDRERQDSRLVFQAYYYQGIRF